MACQNMQFWTFTALVGAFLDLGIAYFVLCASSLAFFVSGFLGLFGLRLPCPCDGMFTRPRNHYCLQRLLFDYPNEKVGYVLCSVRNKFPFHSELVNDDNVGVKLVEDRSDNDNGNGYYVDFEAEASCSSVSDAKVSRNEGEKEMVPRNAIGLEFNIGRWPDKKIDMKGKGISIHRPRTNIRRRRKGGFDHKRSSSVSSHERVVVPRYSSSIKKEKNEDLGGMSTSDEAEFNYLSDDRLAPSVTSRGSGLHDVDLKRFMPGTNLKEKYESSNEDSRSDPRGALSLGDEINTIGGLEQALKEEHAARVALYIELDKERNAAASAADEAMAMILRLQEEKASIEMQARQFQREIEEKSAYDTEEMNILKEIVLRREREKHFLEKEVEAYRQMLCSGKEQSDADTQSMVDKQRREFSSGYLSDDTDLMLHELSESIGKNAVAKGRSSNAEVTFKDAQQRPLVQLGNSEWDEDDGVPQQQGKDQELHEKEMVSNDNSQLARPIEGQRSNNSQEPRFPESTIPSISDEQKKNGFEDIYGDITKNGNTNMSSVPIQIDDHDMKKNEKDMMESIAQSKKGQRVYDVHVINDNSKFSNEASGKKTELLPKTDTSKVISPDVSQEVSDGTKRESSSTSKIGTATDFNRSSLDMAMRLPPSGPRDKSVPASRRSSISVSDTERLKIDIEVEWLREKLKAVQERRTKLNVSVDHDKEKLQMQLLEDIASQLREIRLMTHPEKAMRQASLPLPSSEAMTKKRRHPSAYVNNSS